MGFMERTNGWILNILNLETLKTCRNNTYRTFLLNFINNEIDMPFLLSQINFKINSQSLYNNDSIYIPDFLQRYMLNYP